ncbi:hypothetical protein SAMN05216252_106196 [Actinacidiphila glaucinigra]|uniref:DUF732 domain-containing protein n=2 Tax=Actinacidiphila glaucinigra TaxID=235986 RepID=A0A239EYQ4_9ACTN|nr:hypothetical protein SAMN05216252_106196 [Actinacidiphila glaucinigra]
MAGMRTRLSTAVLLAAVLLAVPACSSGTDDAGGGPEGGATPSAGAPGSKVPDISEGIPEEPTGVERAALLAALKAVDPALAADADKAVANARQQCATINGGGNAVAAAQSRFGSAGHQLTEEQAKAVNEVLERTLCTS